MYKHIYNWNIKYLIKIRAHVGHSKKSLNYNMNSYLYGTRHNIAIINTSKLWLSYKYLFYNLTEMFLKRNSFFLIGTNKNLPMEELMSKWLQQYPFQNKNFNSFYISGYIDKKWIEGLFSNWKIFYEFIDYISLYDIKKKKEYKYEKYFQYLKGIVNLKKMPLPDFFIMLDKDPLALQELKNLQVPLIGFVDTNMNPDDFIYKLFGNNDSVKNLEFFFEFLLEAVKEGRLKEQQLFFFYLIYNIKKKLYKTKKITKITEQSFSKKKFNKNIFIKNNKKSFLKKSKNFEINSNVLHKEKNSSNIISEKDTHGKKH